MGFWKHEIICEQWIKAILIVCEAFSTQQTIWCTLCRLTDCNEKWVNVWLAGWNDRWRHEIPSLAKKLFAWNFTFHYIFLPIVRSKNQQTCENKPDWKNNSNSKEMICFLFHTANISYSARRHVQLCYDNCVWFENILQEQVCVPPS